MIASYLDAEEMMFGFYLPESIIAMASDLPMQYTYANSFITPIEYLARSSEFHLARKSIMLLVNPVYNYWIRSHLAKHE